MGCAGGVGVGLGSGGGVGGGLVWGGGVAVGAGLGATVGRIISALVSVRYLIPFSCSGPSIFLFNKLKFINNVSELTRYVWPLFSEASVIPRRSSLILVNSELSGASLSVILSIV